MTKTSRIAVALSTSILSLGIALAPAAFAAGTPHAKKANMTQTHKAKTTKKAHKAPKASAATPAQTAQ